MRYTEQELRDFLTRQVEEFRAEIADPRAEFYDRGYARGAQQAYEFVLRFMDEYKLEEVTS
jgi:hypothetical protein